MLKGARFIRGGDDPKSTFLAGKERELLESKKWPNSFSRSVDTSKIRIDAFKPWIQRRISELMGVEDDIVVEYCMSQLKVLGDKDATANTHNAGDGGSVLNEKPFLDPKKLQINLTGFMSKKAHIFVKELWDLLLSAQESEYGIPQVFIEEKKREIEELEKEAEKVVEEVAAVKGGEGSESRSRSERVKRESSHRRHRSHDRAEHRRSYRYRSRGRSRDRSRSRRHRGRSRDRSIRKRSRDRSRDRSIRKRSRDRSRDRSHDRSRNHVGRHRDRSISDRDRSYDRSHHMRHRYRGRSLSDRDRPRSHVRTRRRSPSYRSRSREYRRERKRSRDDRRPARSPSSSGSSYVPGEKKSL